MSSVLGWLAVCCGVSAVGAAPVVVTGERLAVELEPAAGYAVTGLVNRAQKVNFIAPPPAGATQDRALWLLTVRTATGSVGLSPGSAAKVEHTLDGGRLTITWSGVTRPELGGTLTVTATVAPRAGGDTAWGLAVTGTVAGALWEVEYPRICGVRSLGDDQLAWPQYLGRLVTRPASRKWSMALSYPQPASMQFLAYWGSAAAREPRVAPVESGIAETGWLPDRSDNAGLYWGAEDGQAYFKLFGLRCGEVPNQLAWSITHVPEVARWPLPAGPLPVDYTIPYPVVIDAFTGDWHEAARRYEAWASKQVWTRRGTADAWSDQQPEAGTEDLVRWIPPWFRQVGFWAKFYQEPAKVLPEWAAYQSWLRVPMASHYYRHPISFFDDNYPEHLPADPYFLQGVRDAKAMGVRPLPYVQGSIWDTDTQSWIRENGVAGAVKSEAGDIHPWDINGEIHAHMCPYTEQWQAKMREAGGKLIGEHGLSGIYLDVLVAERPLPCYDASHGHPLRGGNHWGQGKRRLLYELRGAMRKLDPEACFFSEEIGELYIDVLDGHLSLDQLRFNSGLPGVQNLPLFAAVYHPYTVNFGCDAMLGQDPAFYAWEMAQMLIWGSVPLNSSAVALAPKAGDPAAEYLREVVRAYYQAGRPFLQGGRWERLAVRPTGTPAGPAPLQLAAAPYRLTYTIRQKNDRTWDGPAVMAGAWSRGQRTAVVMANLTAQDQPVELAIRAAGLGLGNARLWQSWPKAEDLGAADGSHRLTVPAGKVRIVEIAATAPAAMTPLTKTDYQLLAVTEGEFPALAGPAGTLYACSDGPVRVTPAGAGVSAAALWLDDQGKLSPRHGSQAKVTGAKAEGRGLPRPADQQPFLLLRRLPHRCSSGETLIYSGDAGHLCAVAPGGATLTFTAPGLIAARSVPDGKLVRGLDQPVADRLTLPAGGPYLVGYAALETLRGHLGLPGEVLDLARLLGPLRELVGGEAKGRAHALALAGEAWYGLVLHLTQLGELVPDRPLRKLGDSLQALAAPYTGWRLRVTADHDWLAPEIAKEVRLAAWRPAGGEPPAGFEVTPLGEWSKRSVGEPKSSSPKTLFSLLPLAHRFQVGEVVERLAPVVGGAVVEAAGERFRLADVLLLEANRPVEMRAQSAPLTAVGGRTATASAVLRNWSPYPVTMTVAATGPQGWRCLPEPARIEVPALGDREVKVAVTPPEDSPRGSYEFLLTANHSAAAETAVAAIMKVALSRALTPLSADGRWQPPKPEERARIRQRGKLVFQAEPGPEVAITIRNVRVTIYANALDYRLLDPDLKVVESGRLPVDQEQVIRLSAKEAGTYTLEVRPGSGSADVTIATRPAAEVATRDDPLQLFTSPIKRWFYVPRGARQFRIGWQDGGVDETAHLTIVSPTGRVAYDFSGNCAGVETPVDVHADEAGRVWTIQVDPRQDMHFWLAGDVAPYLSTSPERVLREAGAP